MKIYTQEQLPTIYYLGQLIFEGYQCQAPKMNPNGVQGAVDKELETQLYLKETSKTLF